MATPTAPGPVDTGPVDTGPMTTGPARYSRTQIALHWIIAVLVIAQFAVNAAVRVAFGDRLGGGGPPPDAGALFHIVSGLAILGLTVLRLAIRLARGAPAPDADIPPLVAAVAKVAHAALYGFLLAMPLTGAIAWFTASAAFGTLHEIGRLLLVPLIAGHAFGALAEHFVLRNDTLRRMLRATAR